MSWSVQIIGTPEKVSAKLDEYSTRISGQSKEEFDEAKPHLQALLSLIVGQSNYGSMIKLNANGHASFIDGKKTQGQISVSLDTWYGDLAL